jgi:hypothetical protein
MIILSIAVGWNQSYFFEENPTWQHIKLKWGIIMAIQNKFWILVTFYLINLWLIWLLIIVMITKLS